MFLVAGVLLLVLGALVAVYALEPRVERHDEPPAPPH